MSHPLPAPAADLPVLEALAGPSYWQRGVSYFEGGRVQLLKFNQSTASADVYGSALYHVTVAHEPHVNERFVCTCSCPLGEDQDYCKHIVAATLMWVQALLAQGESGLPAPKAKATRAKAPGRAKESPADTMAALQAFLQLQSAEALVARLTELAARDKQIQRELLFWMRSRAAQTPAELRKALSTLIGTPGFLDYRRSNAYARQLQSLQQLLEQTLREDPAQAMEGCDYAIGRLLKIYANSDDSGGAIGDRVHALGALHARACAAAKPAPRTLAARLLKLQMEDQWDVVPLAAYSETLGEAGLDSYGDQLRQQWTELPPPKPMAWQPERRRIERRLEAFLRLRGEVDELIKFKSADLSEPRNYLAVIECCLEYGREKAALDWAERGVRAHKTDTELRRTLADLYTRDGFAEEALQLRWANFKGSPTSQHYKELRDTAGAAWPHWRTQALDAVRATEERRRRANEPLIVDQRMQLLLSEDAVDEALTASREGIAAISTLTQLAHRLEAQHPAASAELYRNLVMAQLPDRTGRYEDLVDLIRAYIHLAPADDAAAFIRHIREQNRQKRKLIDTLNALGLV